jgi:hypothetical protein
MLALLPLAGCGSGSPDPAATARSYVGAYDARDGRAICALFVPELRQWLTRAYGHRAGCARLLRAFIGYGEESDTPTFEHLRIGRVAAAASGSTAVVRVVERYRFHNPSTIGPRTERLGFTDTIYLVRRGGRWLVAKPGGVWFLTQSAYQIPPTVRDPPVVDPEAHAAAPRPRARFRCAGRPVLDVHDPQDAPPRLDVRRVRMLLEPSGDVCFLVALRAPPLPATVLSLHVELPVRYDPHGGSDVYDLGVRIGHLGVVRSGSLTRVRAPTSAGWIGSELALLWRRPAPVRPVVWARVRLTAELQSLQPDEPLVRRPLAGRDSAGTGP